MKTTISTALLTALAFHALGVTSPTALWTNGENGIRVYRIPAICTAPNGDLVAACDARTHNAGDLDNHQPINITVRRSSDNGKTWTKAVNSWTWPWNAADEWSGSDPSFVVDREAKKIFLFYNVWDWKNARAVYQFFVQESSDNGKSWSRPRNISKDIAFPAWPFGKLRNQGGFIFISSGSGIQTKDGTLLHTLVHVGDGNALFGSGDHGKTWRPFGKPAKPGDECKVVELNDGRWMINSRWRGGGRQIHVSSDRGETWTSHYDTALTDPTCNAQIMRCGKALLFSNCNAANGRRNMCLRTSRDQGATWSPGVVIHPGRSAYSDMTQLKNGEIGVLYENEERNPRAIEFVVVTKDEIKADICK